jgi:hypothetical protein
MTSTVVQEEISFGAIVERIQYTTTAKPKVINHV